MLARSSCAALLRPRWLPLLALLAAAPALAVVARPPSAPVDATPALELAGPAVGAATALSPRRTLAPSRQVVLHSEATLVGQPDLNRDGRVDGGDVDLLRVRWGTADPAADLDGSGSVDGADLGLLLGAWTPTTASQVEGRS